MTPTNISFQQQYTDAVAWLEIYDASNDAFLNSLKSQLASKKRLSTKQVSWLLRKFNSLTQNTAPKSPLNDAPNNIADVTLRNAVVQFALAYNGTFKFMLDMKKRLLSNSGLTDNQWNAVYKCFTKEKPNNNVSQPAQAAQPVMIDFATPIPITLNRTAAMNIKKTYNLMFGPFTIEVLGFMPGGKRTFGNHIFKFRVNASGAVNVCRICGKSLKDHKSVVSGIGPVCAKGLKHLYHTYQTDIQKFMQQFADECNKIGVMETKFSLFQVNHNMLALQAEIEKIIAPQTVVSQPLVAVNAAPPVPAPVLTPVATPVTVDPVIPVLKYDPTSKLIRVKDNGVNQQMEFHINAESFRELLIGSGLVLVSKSFKLLNTISNTSVIFNRQGMSNTFKGQNMDKVIMFNITEEI